MINEQKGLNDKINTAIWVAHQLFTRKLVTGSTGNISFLFDGIMYISESGSILGLLKEDNFAEVSLSGTIIKGKPSKEYPMHLELYKKCKEINAVVHTHSMYSTVLSCLKDTYSYTEKLMSFTPYLRILSKGKIGIVAYHPPGSAMLFDAFSKTIDENVNMYILNNHGIFVSSDDMIKAFNIVEEFEVSAQSLIILSRYNDSEVTHIS